MPIGRAGDLVNEILRLANLGPLLPEDTFRVNQFRIEAYDKPNDETFAITDIARHNNVLTFTCSDED